MTALRFTFTLPSGETVTGPVQGNGGVISDPRKLATATRMAKEGRPTGCYEPEPGCVVVLPWLSAAIERTEADRAAGQ
jgi:hypothetical protein